MEIERFPFGNVWVDDSEVDEGAFWGSSGLIKSCCFQYNICGDGGIPRRDRQGYS